MDHINLCQLTSLECGCKKLISMSVSQGVGGSASILAIVGFLYFQLTKEILIQIPEPILFGVDYEIWGMGTTSGPKPTHYLFTDFMFVFPPELKNKTIVHLLYFFSCECFHDKVHSKLLWFCQTKRNKSVFTILFDGGWSYCMMNVLRKIHHCTSVLHCIWQ